MNNKPTNSLPVFFNPEKVGKAIQEVGLDYLVVEKKEIETRWFHHAESETDVFIWCNKNREIIKQQINMMGQTAEWNLIDGTKTGYLMEAELDSGADLNHQPTSEVIHFDRKIQEQTLEAAKKIIRCMVCLSEEEKKQLLDNFKGQTLILKKTVDLDTKKQNKSLWNKLLSVFKIRS